MGTARDEAVSQIEAYLRRTLLAMDAGEHWVTVNAGSKTGGEGGGSHVMLDGEGRVVAGMGGKFRGTKVDDIPRKKFINEKAYQRRQESAKKAAASAPKTAAGAPKSDKPTSPAQTAKQRALKQRSEQFRSELGTGTFRPRLDADKDTMSAAGMAVKDHYYSEPLKEGHNYMKVPSPIVRETDRAVAISGRGDSYVKNGELQYRDTVWLPKSHVDIKDGQVIGLSNWIAEEKGLAPLGYQYKTTVQGNTASTSKKLSRMSEADGNRELVMLGRMRNSGKPNALYNQASSATAKMYFAPFEKEDRESGS